MPDWRGLMKAGRFQVQVVINYALLADGVSWEGTGILDKAVAVLPPISHLKPILAALQ